MSRNRLTPAASMHRQPKQQLRKPTSKELDLLVLAGCSCLMTLLYHPIADALQTSPATSGSNGASGAIAAQVSKTSSSQTAPIHCTLPPEREKLKKEEEDDA